MLPIKQHENKREDSTQSPAYSPSGGGCSQESEPGTSAGRPPPPPPAAACSRGLGSGGGALQARAAGWPVGSGRSCRPPGSATGVAGASGHISVWTTRLSGAQEDEGESSFAPQMLWPPPLLMKTSVFSDEGSASLSLPGSQLLSTTRLIKVYCLSFSLHILLSFSAPHARPPRRGRSSWAMAQPPPANE